jgi:hypothetical protein
MKNYTNQIRTKAAQTFDHAKELHVCMGLNSCENLGFSRKNTCAGKGDCSTTHHPCHTLNECKGLGGCGLFGTTEEFCYPTQNDCRFQGSCGAPILSSRFMAQGPNKGRSVWQLARKRFEEKRSATNQKFGTPPAGQFGPSNEYVGNLHKPMPIGDNSACGQSGSRSCSYIADKTEREAVAKARVAAMELKSASEMNETLATCPPRVY